jgi:Villin headpiece domain
MDSSEEASSANAAIAAVMPAADAPSAEAAAPVEPAAQPEASSEQPSDSPAAEAAPAEAEAEAKAEAPAAESAAPAAKSPPSSSNVKTWERPANFNVPLNAPASTEKGAPPPKKTVYVPTTAPKDFNVPLKLASKEGGSASSIYDSITVTHQGKQVPLAELQKAKAGDKGIFDVPGFEFDMKELCLSPKDFETVFGMNHDAFMLLPKWKQVEARKKHSLF